MKCSNGWYMDEESLFNYQFKAEEFNPVRTVSRIN
jgi:hypothetical protein